jgi:hypothetical protein
MVNQSLTEIKKSRAPSKRGSISMGPAGELAGNV